MKLLSLFILVAFYGAHGHEEVVSENSQRPQASPQVKVTTAEIEANVKKMYGRQSLPLYVDPERPTEKIKKLWSQGVLVLRAVVNGTPTCVFATNSHYFEKAKKTNIFKNTFGARISTKTMYFDPVDPENKTKMAEMSKNYLDFKVVTVHTQPNYRYSVKKVFGSESEEIAHDVAYFEVTGEACEKSMKSGIPPLTPIVDSFGVLKNGTKLITNCRSSGTCAVKVLGTNQKGELKVKPLPAAQQKSKKDKKIEDGDSGGGAFTEQGELAGVCSYSQLPPLESCDIFASFSDLEWLRNELKTKYGAQNVPHLSR